MELFKLSTPDYAPDGCESLYYRVTGGSLNKNGNCYDLSDDTIVATNTYFNIFSSSKYAEYTKAENITFTSKVSGKMDICLHMCTSEKDEVVERVPVDSETPIEVSLKFNVKGLSDKEKVTCHYVSFESKGSSKIHEFGSYSADVEQSDVRLALAICTFQREESVEKTVKTLKNMISNPSYDSKQIDIFIIDNGRTLTEDICSESFIHLIPNRNLGGSGGFTRGMIEACEHGATHVLLMDDDISLDPNTVYKTLNILKVLKEEHMDVFILGGMLDSNKPMMQYEAGSLYNGQFKKRKGELDLISEKSLMFNDLFEKTDYGAWWYLCMPTHICDNNLPLPFFIKMDDVEYGLRTMKDHIVMNGIGIWHESFDGKRNRIMENYYHERNFRIVMSIYGLKKYHFFIEFWHKIIFHLSSMDLEAINIYMRGIWDYTVGPKLISDVDEEKLHAEIQSMNTTPYNTAPENLKSLARNSLKANFWRTILKCAFFWIKEIGKRKRVSKEYREVWKNSTTTKHWKARFKM